MIADPEVIQKVAPVGFSWTATLVALLNVLVGGALVAWIKNRPKMRELDAASDKDLRADLMKQNAELVVRLSKVEEEMKLERDQRTAERARHEAQMALLRHRANNSDACLDALLLLLETAPEKVSDAVARVKDMRAKQREAEAIEKATIYAADIEKAATRG